MMYKTRPHSDGCARGGPCVDQALTSQRGRADAKIVTYLVSFELGSKAEDASASAAPPAETKAEEDGSDARANLGSGC